MGTTEAEAPDPSVMAEVKEGILLPKAWVASGEIAWVDAGGRPNGYSFRQPLALANGFQPAGLFVRGFYATSTVPGRSDKLSLGLHVNHLRVFAIDEDGPGGHFNRVGTGRPHFLKRVGFPHLHTVSDDAFEGYAEPLERMKFEEYWQYFVERAEIIGAPEFTLPTIQLGLTV
jgi:hypothetical protein